MVIVQFTNHCRDVNPSLPAIKKLVKFVCGRFGLRKATVSIAIVDNAQFCKLNAKFLKRSRTSDCLSFDLSDERSTNADPMFELVINGEMAVSQAGLRGHSSQAELSLYITHGLLHQLGFTDTKPAQARKMHNTEDEILQSLGYGRVYHKGG
jgi:probable rRNA maturation factor